ncbi:uncharacterized protein METZ01_LOCUS436518 [marine metagenome]|uniref:Uncharacterized protein n=1 Tax=marine metagenome TaxID=408172 RepID=A0A382YKC1_9ZZZZ
MYSIQLSSHSSNNTTDSIFKETIILVKDDKAYSILMHSIATHEHHISGYSKKYDLFMTFQYLPEEIKIIEDTLGQLSNKYLQCINCHQNHWN